MSKFYFTNKKKKQDPSLTKIIVVLVCIFGAIVLAMQLPFRFGGGLPRLGGDREAMAMDRIEAARTHFEAGDMDAAAAELRPLIGRIEDPVLGPEAYLLLAEIDLENEDTGAALQGLESALTRFARSPAYPEIMATYAKLLERVGRTDEALQKYAQLRDQAPPEMGVTALVGLGRQAERDGNLIEAREMYRQAMMNAPWGSQRWSEAADAFGELNVELIFASTETPESRVYNIESGDTLTSIGIKLNTTQGLLIRANSIDDPARIRPNQRLKYTPKDFRIVIERSTLRLFLLDKDGLFKRYHVGLGMPGYDTALGIYTIGNKEVDPTWHKPGSEPIPPGHPENELGARWMPLVPAEEGLPTDLGIHGTIAPETIGQYASRGCPRLLNEQVEELYDLVVRSTPVEIVESVDPVLLGLVNPPAGVQQTASAM